MKYHWWVDADLCGETGGMLEQNVDAAQRFFVDSDMQNAAQLEVDHVSIAAVRQHQLQSFRAITSHITNDTRLGGVMARTSDLRSAGLAFNSRLGRYQVVKYESAKWLGGVTVRTLDLRSIGRVFDSRSGHYRVVTTWMGDGGQVNHFVETQAWGHHASLLCNQPPRQCYFSCDFLVIVIVKVIIFQVFQLQF